MSPQPRTRTASEALGLRLDRLSLPGCVALACGLLALWMLGRRYGGITHDATIYLAMGLRRLYPDAFAKDLFFAHGGQDSFSLFPLLYAQLIGLLGADAAALLVTVTGQAAFLAAAAAVAFRMAAGHARWWSLALLAVSSGYYGGGGVFRIAEPFATARTLAEPLVIAALALTLAGRHRLALSLAAAAMTLHPLVGASGMAVLALRHAFETRRLLWLAAAALTALAALAATWPRMAHTFDPAWLEAVVERSPHLFVGQWQLPDWARLFWGLCVLVLARRFVEARVRSLLAAAASAGIAGIAASWLAVDMLGSALAGALQMWRTHWLVHFLAIVAVPLAVAGLWRSQRASQAAAACLAASWCFGRSELAAAALLAALAVILDASERRSPGWMGERAFRFSLFAALFAASVGLMFEVQTRLPLLYTLEQPLEWRDYLPAVTSVGGLLPLAVLLWLGAYSRFAPAAALLASAGLATSWVLWDARAPWNQFVERAGFGASPFRSALPRGAEVFWPTPGGPAWQLLGAPSWFSVDQGAGIVFNRATALIYDERRRVSRELRASMAVCSVAPPERCTIDIRTVRALCGRDDRPHSLVLNAPVDGHAGLEWSPPLPAPHARRLYLYSCEALAKK